MNPARIEYCLNGTWRLVLDPDDVGARKRWFVEAPLSDSIQVTVPSVWDLWAPDYDGVGWYFRDFELVSTWGDRYVALEFDAVDYFAEVWLNGVPLGAHEGGYTPFTLDTTAAVRSGTNRLAVRVVDPHGPNGFGDFKPRQIPSAKENGYWSFAGIWGGVRLIGKHHAHTTDIFVRPDPRRKRLTAAVATSEPGAEGGRGWLFLDHEPGQGLRLRASGYCELGPGGWGRHTGTWSWLFRAPLAAAPPRQ